MPQASTETVERYFSAFGLEEHDDALGYDYARNWPGVVHHRGTFYYTNKTAKEFNEKMWAALNYLCDEWDYATGHMKDCPKGVLKSKLNKHT